MMMDETEEMNGGNGGRRDVRRRKQLNEFEGCIVPPGRDPGDVGC